MRSSVRLSFPLFVVSLALVLSAITLVPCPADASGVPASIGGGDTPIAARARAAGMLAPRLRDHARPAPRSTALGPACPSHYDAQWWDGFALPIQNGEVRAFAEDGADLIVGGSFIQTALVKAVRVARWDGTGWSAVGDGVPNTCNALTRWNGHLVAGCQISAEYGVAQELVFEFDGTSWHPLGTLDGPVFVLAVYGGDLIAGGEFTHADGESVGAVARWDGTRWQPLGSGFPAGNARALAVYGTELIVGGQFSNFGGIARWDGASWTTVGGGRRETST